MRVRPEALLEGPDAGLPPGGLVVRPSLRAAIAVPFQFLLAALFVGASLLYAAPEAPREAGALALVFLFEEYVGLFIVVGATLGPLVKILATRYVFLDEALVVRSRFLTSTEQRVEWPKVTALLHRRTVLDRVLRIERLDVVAYGARGTTLHLIGLRGAAPLRDLVARKMRVSASVESLFAND